MRTLIAELARAVLLPKVARGVVLHVAILSFLAIALQVERADLLIWGRRPTLPPFSLAFSSATGCGAALALASSFVLLCMGE